ncbi:caspase-8-like [Neosynchiropus ocellatus]
MYFFTDQLQSKPLKKDELYPLNSNPVGLCLIINNKNFQDGSTRRGSDRDAQSLGEVFSMLGFHVLMYEDQTMEQMRQRLRSFGSLSDHTQLQGMKEFTRGRFTELQEVPQHGDAFFCCILTHGLKGVVLGVDRKALSVKEITAPFRSTHQLTGRPKVFLIQACQGGQEQQGVLVPEMEADLEEDGHQASIPAEADVLVAMATVEDYVSLRHPVNGSWFIQTLCQELRIGCQRDEDFFSILTRVNDEVSKKEGYGTVGARKQMPEVRFTLRKRLVLPPQMESGTAVTVSTENLESVTMENEEPDPSRPAGQPACNCLANLSGWGAAKILLTRMWQGLMVLYAHLKRTASRLLAAFIAWLNAQQQARIDANNNNNPPSET